MSFQAIFIARNLAIVERGVFVNIYSLMKYEMWRSIPPRGGHEPPQEEGAVGAIEGRLLRERGAVDGWRVATAQNGGNRTGRHSERRGQ